MRRRRGAGAAEAGARAAAVVAVVAGALALASAAAWMPQWYDNPDSGPQCGGGGGGGDAAPVVRCAAAQGARMSVAVSIADDVLVMGEGGVHLRGTAVVSGYDPREGHMFQEIRAEPSGRVVSKSKIFPRIGAGGEWAAQVGATLAPETYPPGSYSIGVVTESGLRSPRAGFAVSGGPAEVGNAPPPPPPAEAGTGTPAEPGLIGDSALGDAVEMVRAAPAEAARLDPPLELPALPDLDDAVPAALPDFEDAVPAALPGIPPPDPAPAPAPADPAPAAVPPGAAEPASSGGPSAPAPAQQPGAGAGLLGYLAGLLTAGYLVTIVLSAVISFFVMMAIRYAMRRARRRRAARRP